jgi:hypothetical protein
MKGRLVLSIRKLLAAALCICAALAAAAPGANAQVPFPFPAGGNVGPIGNNPATALGPCSSPSGAEGQGGAGHVENQTCVGAGLSFTGPAIGQIATVIGPTIISPGFAGTVVVSAGSAAVMGGPGAL